jgi:trehalose 6-phosphate phosphatase
MRYLFSPSCRPILLQLSQARTLCAFDFDGTLAPIVVHPESARLRVRTRHLLERAAALYPCVVVSGRARADVLAKLGDLRLSRVIGNHGAETGGRRTPRKNTRNWKAVLSRSLAAASGVWIEDKGASLAIHYRQSPRKTEARKRILEAAKGLPGARVLGGKQVVNIVSDKAPHKGDAILAERNRLGCGLVLYVGDDDNDEDAFAAGENVIPVRVGAKRGSHALYYLRSQKEIDTLLERLIELRRSARVG